MQYLTIIETSMLLKKFQKDFDILLESFLSQKVKDLLPYAKDEILGSIINNLLEYKSGGKRLRPFLIDTIYSGFTEKKEDIHKILLAYEMIHSIALIHDDIMDQGTMRHGRPTCHKFIEGLYGLDEHTGISQGILVGDWFFGWAYELLFTSGTNSKISSYFCMTVQELIMGQMIDTHLSKIPLVDTTQLIKEKDILKSGAYSFKRPMGLGGLLAGVDQKTLSQIEKLGDILGAVYQMRDDLLDITGTHGHDNKTRFSDLSEGNQTIVLYEALKNISAGEKEYILSHRGKKMNESTIDKISEIIQASGAIESTIDQINSLLDQSQVMLDDLIDSHKNEHTALSEIISYLRV